LLLVLVQNEGRILNHDELLDKVRDGTFVEQSNLKKSISALRHILGEHADGSLYIKNIARRGYSFVSPVRILPDEIEAAGIYPKPKQKSSSKRLSKEIRRKRVKSVRKFYSLSRLIIKCCGRSKPAEYIDLFSDLKCAERDRTFLI